MVNFGKKLKERQIPEWQRYYINYKLMKKKVRQHAQQIQEGTVNRRSVLKDFSKMLDYQIEKTVLFVLQQQGHLASRIEALGEERERLMQQAEIPQLHALREEYRLVGQDLLKLLHFVEINATGLRKILKKFDKRSGYKITDYYVTTRSNHPYSQLQQVFKHVGIGAVVGALSRNLAELQSHRGSYLSIYDQPISALALQDPVIDEIKDAVERLTHSTNFLRFLGQHALIIQEDLPRPSEEYIEDQRYHFVSLVLNLVNTFLYMVNTYIIVPTADDYSMSLGAAATLCGVVIGSMAFAQLISSVYFSAWSNRSYFRPLIFSSIVLLLGNVMYAIAYDARSLSVLIIGRILCGILGALLGHIFAFLCFPVLPKRRPSGTQLQASPYLTDTHPSLGSARAVNRRYISDCVPLKTRLQASAAFVSASALGMAAGPALAGLLQMNKSFLGLTLNQSTLPGWVMAIAWLVYLVWLWISFKEPAREDEGHVDEASNKGPTEESTVEDGLTQPLLLTSQPIENALDEEGDQEADGSEESAEVLRKPASSFIEAYKLLTKPVKVQLLIYFMLKYAMEILLSESSVVTAYYFNWGTGSVAIFLALLGLTVLPVNVVVGNYISNMFEDRQILFAAEIFTCLGVFISFNVVFPYSVAQYVCGAFITFVSAEVLEGVNLSLLSKVMSSRLARGTYNGGLLSTEAGTLARVVADVTITLAGYVGQGLLLNLTLLPTLIIGILSLYATGSTYNSLF